MRFESRPLRQDMTPSDGFAWGFFLSDVSYHPQPARELAQVARVHLQGACGGGPFALGLLQGLFNVLALKPVHRALQRPQVAHGGELLRGLGRDLVAVQSQLGGLNAEQLRA